MSHVSFEDGLKKLSMINKICTTHTGFYSLDQNNIDNTYIRFHLDEAKRYEPTAIYVTQLENQAPKPQIYIYDNTGNKKLPKDIKQLHKELWNSAKVPMFFVFTDTEVKIYNCRKSSDDGKNVPTALEIVKLTSDAQEQLNKIKSFDAKMFDSGAFWNQEKYAKEFEFKHSVYDVLLDDLMSLREELIAKSALSEKTTESLLIKSILIKYLDERGVFNQQERDNYWSQFLDNATTFTELFNSSSSIVNLLDTLKEHFNGGVFDISNDREELLDKDLSAFKKFLEADTETTQNKHTQKLIWSKYSFKDLPVELISNIYELFLKSEEKETNGIVYTPPILVDFMIDEVMPLDEPKKDFKLIDPSCGSGIFLVAAYKRLIQWWTIEHNWGKPTISQAQQIIKDSIFGVDKEDGAVEVSLFSISLALCDTFLPEEIWDDLKFEDLRKSNIVQKDFFLYMQDENTHNIFDLVIGNPPFVNKQAKWTNIAKEVAKNDPVPDTQLSFLFIKQSLKLLKPSAYLCMIQPSAFLYSQGTFNFRNNIFTNYKCHQVIDFACLNTSLFKKSKNKNSADVAISVSFIQNIQPDIEKDNILHLAVRQTFLAKEKIYFDLSYYDFHWLKYKDVLEQKSIWKCDLMGGSRIRSIIKRLEQYTTLKDFLKNKEKDGWIYKSGFFTGNKKTPKDFFENNFLTNRPTLPTSAFSENGIDYSKIELLQESTFEAPRQMELFQEPLVLIKEIIGKQKLAIEYVDKSFLSFRKGINGIHAPMKDKKKLKQLAKTLKDQSILYIFYTIATSGRAGVSKATSLLKNDIDLLPYPKNIQDLQLSKTEQYFANDTLDYMMDFCKGTSKSPLLKDVNDIQMIDFENVYCELLNTVYKEVHSLGNKKTSSYVCVAFYFKTKPMNTLLNKDELSDAILENLVKNKVGKNIHITRILRFYDDNVIYFIKPKQYRFWLKSIAVRDADETFSDLIKMGY